jgi:DNA-binding response OmpR family regulator
MRRALVLDSKESVTFAIALQFGRRGFAADRAHWLAQADAPLALHRYDIVVADPRMGQHDGIPDFVACFRARSEADRVGVQGVPRGRPRGQGSDVADHEP